MEHDELSLYDVVIVRRAIETRWTMTEFQPRMSDEKTGGFDMTKHLFLFVCLSFSLPGRLQLSKPDLLSHWQNVFQLRLTDNLCNNDWLFHSSFVFLTLCLNDCSWTYLSVCLTDKMSFNSVWQTTCLTMTDFASWAIHLSVWLPVWVNWPDCLSHWLRLTL